jgi:hypothetical protein
MLFDIWFLGFPLACAICLINLALKDGDIKYWRCAISFTAYITFYLAGGRDVILYITCGMLLAHAWVGTGAGGIGGGF